MRFSVGTPSPDPLANHGLPLTGNSRPASGRSRSGRSIGGESIGYRVKTAKLGIGATCSWVNWAKMLLDQDLLAQQVQVRHWLLPLHIDKARSQVCRSGLDAGSYPLWR